MEINGSVAARQRAEVLQARSAYATGARVGAAALAARRRAPGREPAAIPLTDVDEFEQPGDWQAQALCREADPEAFFPEKGDNTREARRVCARCVVKSQCLDYALKNDEEFGIWGGLTEDERRRLKRRVA